MPKSKPYLSGARAKSKHQLRVEDFIKKTRQKIPIAPTVGISEKIRILQAKLIMEETLKTIRDGLGIQLRVYEKGFEAEDLDYHIRSLVNLEELAGGCADIMVATTGTLSAFGISDLSIQETVDFNNLAKFGPGHKVDRFGKLIKPPGHEPPAIQGVLADQVNLMERIKNFKPES